MSKTTDLILFCREEVVKALDGLTVDQINKIPAGFNNNLIWNLSHVIAVEQAICYLRSGAAPLVDRTFIEAYGQGTFPEDHVDQAGIDAIKKLALSSPVALAENLKSNAFEHFQPFAVTPKAVMLSDIDEALNFVLFHEGMHAATIRAMIRTLDR